MDENPEITKTFVIDPSIPYVALNFVAYSMDGKTNAADLELKVKHARVDSRRRLVVVIVFFFYSAFV
jgi:hypothetical protein